MGRQPADPSWQAVETEDIAGVTMAEICLPWSCCLFFFCNPPRWSGRAQLQGTKQAESLASFCTLLPVSWRLLSWQISRLGLLVCSVHELLGTAAVPEALASSPPAALLHDH